MRSFTILAPKGPRIIGGDQPCFIVAEVSCNHQQKIEQAEAIIRAAAAAGADAVKLQTYKPETMTIDSDKPWFRIDGAETPDTWTSKTFFQIYKEAYTPWEEWHPRLKALAESLGLILFSTPFDSTAVDFLESLNMPVYKIASYEASDIPLLRRIAQTKKPIIISFGFEALPEIDLSMKTLRDNGAKDIAILHCTTGYHPAGVPDQTHLRTMAALRERFDVAVGFSDNMGGTVVPALAAAMGAAIIEKHLVLRHDAALFDDRFSLDQTEFKTMVDAIRWQEKVAGAVFYGPATEAGKHNKRFQRSLFAVKAIKKGEAFTAENIRVIRPADGLEPKYWDEIMTKCAAADIERGTPLSWNLVQR